MENTKRKTSLGEFLIGLDHLSIITAVICSVFGFILVYSSVYASLNPDTLIKSSIKVMLVTVLSTIVGIIIALVLSMINYEAISKLWPFIAGACVALMIVTYFFGTGPADRPDARSWLDFKIFTIQTSEFLKIGFIISFSYHLDLVKDHINRIKSIIPLVIHGLIPVALVVLTGDAGSALIFLLMLIGMLFFARIHIGYFAAGICSIIVAFIGAWRLGIINGLQRSRIEALFYPEEYADVMYQQTNGKIALGSGGLFGQGYLQGKMTQGGSVPVNESDMILTVAGEEFGYIGAMAVILLLAVLIIRIAIIGLKARDNAGYLMCMGISAMLFAQVVVNIGMELSLLPCIGITLPLFSSGGSSSLSIYISLGIALSVHRYSKAQNVSLFYKY